MGVPVEDLEEYNNLSNMREYNNIDTVKPGQCLYWKQVQDATSEQKKNHCGQHPLIFNDSVSKMQRIATFYCQQPDCFNCQHRKYDREAKQIEQVFNDQSEDGVLAGIVAKTDKERLAIVRRLDGQYLSIPFEDGVLILSNNRHSRKKDQYIEFAIDQIDAIMEKRELATGNYSGGWWKTEKTVDEDTSESRTFLLPRIVPIPKNPRLVFKANSRALACLALRRPTLQTVQAYMIERDQLVVKFLNEMAGEQIFRLSYENEYEHTVTKKQIDSGKLQATRVTVEIAGFQGNNKHDTEQRALIENEFNRNVLRSEYETRKLVNEQSKREAQYNGHKKPEIIQVPETITADSSLIVQVVPDLEIVSQNGHGLNGSEKTSPPHQPIDSMSTNLRNFTMPAEFTDEELDRMGFLHAKDGETWFLMLYEGARGGVGDLIYDNGVLIYKDCMGTTPAHFDQVYAPLKAGTALAQEFFNNFISSELKQDW